MVLMLLCVARSLAISLFFQPQDTVFDCVAKEGMLQTPVAGVVEMGYVLLFHSWPHPVKNHLDHNVLSAATEILAQDTRWQKTVFLRDGTELLGQVGHSLLRKHKN